MWVWFRIRVFAIRLGFPVECAVGGQTDGSTAVGHAVFGSRNASDHAGRPMGRPGTVS